MTDNKALAAGDRVLHKTTQRLGIVVEVGEGWDLGSARVQLDGDPLPIDTRIVYLAVRR